MNSKELWEMFRAEYNIKTEEHQVWQFGFDADELLDLVVKEKKTATSSADILYALGNETLPVEGLYNVILNAKEEAICIVQTTKVDIIPFNRVSEKHACKEGEGDGSLEHWRESHKNFFSEELLRIGEQFDENMKIVCEEFCLVYRK